MRIPRVAAIHDLSGFGRCSLAVIIPILSCMGAQVCPIPTAILSTHTGGFYDIAFTDLTTTMESYIDHWKQLDLEFEYIYTGFLGNENQFDTVVDFCTYFKKGDKTCVVVDPVMGDEGVLYSTYNDIMQERMRELVTKADIITPNLTETMFLLKKPYEDRPFSNEEMKTMLIDLANMGPKSVIITGITDQMGVKVNIAYDKRKEMFWKIPYTEVKAFYPGTGDVFTSVLIGGFVRGYDLSVAIDTAASFVSLAIQATEEEDTPGRDGIAFEKVMSYLLEPHHKREENNESKS